MNILAIIPARGGSKGIPRKNIRLLNGKPLIYYSISNALKSKYDIDIYVSSDDEEILNLSKLFGAKLHRRNSELSKDETTLDPVIYDAYLYAKNRENKDYDLIITLQATSPLLKTSSLDLAIEKMINNKGIDTIISATDDTHLTWRYENGKYIPNYKKRVNRQYLTPTYKETGGFLITRKNIISPNNRIGKNVELFNLSFPENVDIDTFEDWNLCEYYLKRKKILFVVRGNQEVGLGHVYNTLILANDIVHHDIRFLVLKDSELAYKKISEYNYSVYLQEDDLIEEIDKLKPDVVINDILDTKEEYIYSLKRKNIKVINFEDLGKGAKKADLVINAIYPEKYILPNHYFGPKYYLLRDEFVYINSKNISEKVSQVLITFGGVDPLNLTKKVLDSIYSFCKDNSINIKVILGFGYSYEKEIKDEYKDIEIVRNISSMAEEMNRSDIVFSSAGRTIYEIASIGRPTIVLCQNERELTHFFAAAEYGFINLGLGNKISNREIKQIFEEIVFSYQERKRMVELMKDVELKKGRKRVRKLILDLIEGEDI